MKINRLKLDKLKLDKNQWVVVILIGVLLLVIAIPTDTSKTSVKESSDQEETQMNYSSSEYEQKLEQRLEAILSQIDGVGEVNVMITLKDSGESVVEKDTTTSNRTESNEQGDSSSEATNERTTVYSGDDIPYESKEIKPDVEGVLVVAQGAGTTQVETEIYEAVLALFPVEAHKIKIVKMGNQEE